ncbi:MULTISPECIES: glycosyl transferase [Vibrio]|uniref:Glycosyl transferase n=1 Tax=Vibrio anguillarum TaxID=55601 RepID=A0ABR9Z955_VIBAN|nr:MULTISPECIES: glycosyl transferase [Vibrio]MBF4374948.1 glycosyl transferase [Vibrio anguillarum]NNN99370.1 glycosyl transferase [Vibrio sp. B1-2]
MANITIGVLYICTGEYHKFWPGFYENAKKFLAIDAELKFFVFTDNKELIDSKLSDVSFIYKESKPWPEPTLFRYHAFLEHSNLYAEVDYLIFCNANLKFVRNIKAKELFLERDMFCTIHPGYFDKSYKTYPYELNSKSTAYLKSCSESIYIAGGFNGGRVSSFLEMSNVIARNTDVDLENSIVARWHDESHINNYYSKNKAIFNVLSEKFCCPDSSDIISTPSVIVIDKSKVISLRHKGNYYVIRSWLASYFKKIIKYLSK